LRDNDPGSEVNDNTGTKGEEGDDQPDQTYDTRIDIEMLAEPSADPAKHLLFSGAVQPFHVHKMVF